MKKNTIIFLVLAFLFSNSNLFAQDSSKIKNFFQKNVDVSGQWFISGNYDDADSLWQFELKRGYFTIESQLTKNLSARYTQDITLDTEGEDAGNVEMRLKYLYLQQDINFLPKFQKGAVFVGMIHRPWVEYEQKINSYRVLGPLFLENSDVISSADFGIAYEGLIGGEIDEDCKKNVNSKDLGKYGSFSFGLYNGGGYHAIEQNNNKTFETRLTARPFYSFMPGLQVGYAFVTGKANVKTKNTKFNMNVFYLSSESKHHVLLAQYYKGKGDFSGKYVDTLFNSNLNDGYSVFGEFKIPKTKFSIVGRYEYFTSKDKDTYYLNRINAGIAYRFLKNKIVFGAEYKEKNSKIRRLYEIALEIRF
ncbi:MAG: hypothetical protein GX259_08650 [Bacteroidales bacterium]|nr:hypothetical protein [Bacteroidales bacterium]